MLQLVLSLISSLLVGFYLKKTNISKDKNFILTLLGSYLTSALLCYFLFQPVVSFASISIKELAVIISLSILMPSVFLFLNESLKINGLAKTDIFQRLSLIIPVSLSFWLFGEQINYVKLLVILLSFLAITLLLYKKSTINGNYSLILSVAVFMGYGIIDTLFKIIAINLKFTYTTLLYIVFLLCSLFTFIYLFISKTNFFQPKHLMSGVILGILNFSNIYFYLSAHKNFKDSPTLVFIIMNLGVIIGGLLIGSLYFKERLTSKNKYGIICAVLAIILLALNQMKIV